MEDMHSLSNLTCRTQDRHISRASLDGAAHDSRAQRGGCGQHSTPTGRFAKKQTIPLIPQTINTTLLSVSQNARSKHEQKTSCVNRLIIYLSARRQPLFVPGC